MTAPTLERVRELLAQASYRFAKTMPENPHWYTLRKTWDSATFSEVVAFIRANGHVEWWPNRQRGKQYTYLDLDGYHYWTMGAPVEETILINRKPLEAVAAHDHGYERDPKGDQG